MIKFRLISILSLFLTFLLFQNFETTNFQKSKLNFFESLKKEVSGELALDKLIKHNQITYTLFIDENGRDENMGSESSPIFSLKEAQVRIDKLVNTLDLSNKKTQFKNFKISIKLYVSGVFKGQVFRWVHPYKNLDLLISNKSGSKAEFYGYGHPCFSIKCESSLSEPRNTSSRQPVVCSKESARCNIEGLTFFAAPGDSTDFKRSKGYDGYGGIVIQGLKIKYYWSGINIYSQTDSKPRLVSIKKNIFYKIGQNGNPGYWPPAYSAIIFKNIDGALVSGNKFVNIKNFDMPSLLHGLYLSENSDHNLIENNVFRNISGNPIKLRDGSDFNLIIKNRFIKGENGIKNFPIQNWYNNWYKTDAELQNQKNIELPSMGTIVSENNFLEGYYKFPTAPKGTEMNKILCSEKTLVAPKKITQSYIEHAKKENTYSRFIIDGINFNHESINCD